MCDHCESDITLDEAYAEMNRVAGDLEKRTALVNAKYQNMLDNAEVVNGFLKFRHE